MIIRRMPLFILFAILDIARTKINKKYILSKTSEDRIIRKSKKTKNLTMEIDRKEAPTETKKGPTSIFQTANQRVHRTGK